MDSTKRGDETTPSVLTPPKRVLVVEDDPFWRALIQASLDENHRDLKIDFAVGAEEALSRALGPRNYDLIISDFQLEGRANGLDFWNDCRRMKIETPFLLTSGLTVDRLPTSAAQGPQFVSKSRLRETLRDWRPAAPALEDGPRLSRPSLLLGVFGGKLQGLTILSVVAAVIGFAVINENPGLLRTASASTPAPAAPIAAAPTKPPVPVRAPALAKNKPAAQADEGHGLTMTPALKAKIRRALQEGDDVLKMAE